MTPLMSDLQNRRRTALRAVVLAATLMLLLPYGANAQSDEQEQVEGKKFAAEEYGWYPIEHVDHFETRKMPRYWKQNGPGIVRAQNGMITIYSKCADRRNPRCHARESVGATMTKHVWDRGRWEIRMRATRFQTEHTDYFATAELIPSGDQAYNCGARNIGLASFQPESHSVSQYARTLPDNEFSWSKTGMNLSNNYWHTYAVEVTPKRISWYTDGVVRRTERRPEALSGIPLALRLQLTAVPGQTMNWSRLQVDTVRFFTLKSKNKKSTRAPQPAQGTYADAC
jgi:hypothetical protein